MATPEFWDIFHDGATVPVLPGSACDAVVETLLAHEADWTRRQALEDQVHLFHTLGAATYLDAPASYDTLAARSNPVLRESFADLHESVANAIAERTGIPATLTETLALPGFHIFRGDPRVPPGLMFGGTIHMDKPHERHGLHLPPDGTLSLTLPLRIPREGAGMYFWQDVPDRLLTGPKAPHEMSAEQLAWFDAQKKYVGYTVGEMVLHDGLTVHQLANPGRTTADEWRISLQGHGVLSEGQWELFF